MAPMPHCYIFADEAGCLTFNRNPNVSRYFIVCTITMEDLALATDMIALRKRLAWDGADLGEYFHATTDRQAVRDAVFDTIAQRPFGIQVKIMEKSKAQPQVRASDSRFYQYGWYFLFKHGTARRIPAGCNATITAASIGSRRSRAAFQEAVNDVVRQTVVGSEWKTDFCPAHADPCLQAADYCAWAIQRLYEKGDSRSYDLIKDKITYEKDIWKTGTQHWY